MDIISNPLNEQFEFWWKWCR